MPESELPELLRPPAMSSEFGWGSGRTTSRLIGAASCQGSSPASAAATSVSLEADGLFVFDPAWTAPRFPGGDVTTEVINTATTTKMSARTNRRRRICARHFARLLRVARSAFGLVDAVRAR